MSKFDDFTFKLEYLLSVGYDQSIVTQCKACWTKYLEQDTETITYDLSNADESCTVEVVKEENNWNDQQAQDFYLKLRQALEFDPRPFKPSSIIDFTASENRILSANDNLEKQKKIIHDKLDQFKQGDIKDFLWQCLNATNSPKSKVLKINKRPKDDDSDDEKEDNDTIPTAKNTATLDFKDAEQRKNGMCRCGYTWFEPSDESSTKCIECGKKSNDLMYCGGCQITRNIPKSSCSFCNQCRMSFYHKYKNKNTMNMMKSEIIRNAINNQPELSVDLLCGLPTKTSLDDMLHSIYDLSADTRSLYGLFLIDVDNLKALNSTLGHEGADEIIKSVGGILKEYQQRVNDGDFASPGYKRDGLETAYVFRQGGDEFAVIVKGQDHVEYVDFDGFYNGWKREINALAEKYKHKLSKQDIEKGRQAMKDRKLSSLKTVVNGLKGVEYKRIEAAINNQEIEFNMDVIGISVGLYVPKAFGDGRDWVKYAEEAQDAAKAIAGKNSMKTYFNGSIE